MSSPIVIVSDAEGSAMETRVCSHSPIHYDKSTFEMRLPERHNRWWAAGKTTRLFNVFIRAKAYHIHTHASS